MAPIDERNQERAQKAAAITGLALNFGKDMPKPLFQIWMRRLEKETAEDVALAVTRIIESYEYKTLPPLAVLLKHLPSHGPALPDPEREKAVKAEAEWQYILDSIRHCGRYGEPLMHPVTAYVVRGMGGWWSVCDWLESELHWRKKEFVAAWIQTDGLDLAMLEGGARAIEQRRAQIALGTDDDRTLRRITRDSVKRIRIQSGEEVAQ